MSLLDQIKINSKLPFEEDYKEDVKEHKFLETSYEANGIEYTMADAPDGPIIHKLECEETKEHNLRCKQTPSRSYVSSILNKYNSAVFKNEPVRQASSPTIEALFVNADGYGNSINSLMRKALLESQKFESFFLMADSTATDTEILTIAQKQSAGAFPYIRCVDPKSVINYIEIEDKLIEAIILLEDENGKVFARWMNEVDFIDIELETKEYRIKSIGEAYAHGYNDIPLVEIEPLDNAQALPIAHSQRVIVNILSLLQQELNDSVFSKFILSGVRIPEDDSGSTKKISWSGKRMVVLEDQGANLQLLGADHGAADSLRKEIEQEETQMYYSAGFGKPTVEPTNVSGLSRLIALEDFFNVCNALKHAIESAENKIGELIAYKEGTEWIPTVYSDKYIADDNGEALGRLRDLLALNLPSTFKSLAIKEYINTFYNVSDEDKLLIEQELLAPPPEPQGI
jgi:hypothetical protein